MSADLVHSYNEQVLSREAQLGEPDHDAALHQSVLIDHDSGQCIDADQRVHVDATDDDDDGEEEEEEEEEERPISRSRHTSTSSSGLSSEPAKPEPALMEQPEAMFDDVQAAPQTDLQSSVDAETEKSSLPTTAQPDPPKPTKPAEEPAKKSAPSTPDPLQCQKNHAAVINALKATLPEVKKEEPLVKTMDKDENDWARQNQGRGRLSGLIERFNQGAVLNENNAEPKPATYKSDYGVGKGRGQLSQDVFH